MEFRGLALLVAAIGAGCTSYDGPLGSRGGDDPGCVDQGCECDPGAAPVACFLDKTVGPDGTPMCHEGSRHCRDGRWSACEDVHSYAMPERPATGALIDPTLPPENCNDCDVKCFVIRDNLDPVDGGLDPSIANGTKIAAGGGLTLANVPDASWTPPPPDGGWGSGPTDNPVEKSGCVVGTAPDWDCDSIEDVFDPYPFAKPFATTNPAIFLDIAPGETGTGIIDLRFFITTLDLYLLVDGTQSMQSVHQRIDSTLTVGTFLDATVECADTDLDGKPNQELKSQGFLGGVRCLVRDSWLGAGLAREIPFDPYGHLDELTYLHLLDVTNNTQAIVGAVDSFTLNRDKDWPDGQALALYSVVTGNGLYMGLNRPGVSPRVGCPGGTWGYPCFRQAALPVLLLFTDAPMHNGPVVQEQRYEYPMNYDPARLAITAGTTAGFITLPITHETFPSAYDLGDVSTRYRTFAGDTTPMASNYDRATMACLAPALDGAPDAAFAFDVSTTTNVTISTQGSSFGAAIGLFNRATEAPTVLASNGTNESWLDPFDVGQLYARWKIVGGTTAPMVDDYPGSFVSCNASDASPDAVFAFSLLQPATVAIDAAGSTYDTVLSLHSSAPVLPVDETTVNTNDHGGNAKNLGDVYQQDIRVSGGDTSLLAADYTELQIGCSADTASPDSVFRFTLSEPTSVRIDTVGSSFDTVLALTDGNFGNPSVVEVPLTNDTQASAYPVGNVVGAWREHTSSTTTLTADYRDELIGCGAGTNSPDAVYAFSVSTTTKLRLDTAGSSYDTVLSVHDGPIDPIAKVSNAANANETDEVAFGLGTLNDRWIELLGTSTSGMRDDYESDFIGCGAATVSPDAVYKFDLAVGTTVRVDTISSAFDTVVSLHDGPPPRHVSTPLGVVQELYDIGSINNSSRVFTGSSTETLLSDYGGTSLGCAAIDASADVAFKFSVQAQTTVEINTAGTTFDTVLGLYPATIKAPKEPPPIAVPNTNETKAAAYSAGNMAKAWGVFTGDTQNMLADFGAFGCGATAGARDAVFSFSLSTTTPVQVSSGGSSFDTVIGLFRSSDDALLACDADSGSGVTSQLDKTLLPGDYHVVLKGQRTSERGPYKLGIRDLGEANVILCDDDLGGSGASRIAANLAPGTYHAVVKAKNAAAKGPFQIRFTDRDWYAIDHRITCDDDSGGGPNSRIEWDLGPGSYYVVVKGDLGTEQGPYTLRARDMESAVATSREIACNDNGPSGSSSQLDLDLQPGTYWAVVKGKGSGLGSSGSYKFSVRDLGSGAQGVLLACNDDDPLGGTHSVIARDLPAGTYFAYVKGDLPTDQGGYALRVADMTHAPVDLVACNDDAAGGGTSTSRIEQNLLAGDYWAVLKGKGATDRGAYSLAFRDLGSATRQSLACEADGELTTTLPPGAYDLLVKGGTTGAAGSYRVTIGNGQTTASSFVPPDWGTTLNQLVDNDVRVMSVLSCHDLGNHGEGRECDDLRQQTIEIANATGALGANFEPMVFDIDANGTGLETAILGAVKQLASYLEMDIGVRLVFEPDANPGFGVSVEAVDAPADGCTGVVGVEHQNCVPGATPTFHLRFTNPFNAPIPLNPNDPKGGYLFRADLIADGKYFVDAVSIYIVPRDVNGSVPGSEPLIVASGTYRQDVKFPLGCLSGELPEWRDLSWTANLPNGTAIDFSICTADTAALLDTCNPTLVARIVGSGSCTVGANCTSGFCAQNGVCQTITSGSCTQSSECHYGSTCANGTCVYAVQPVSVAQPLGPAAGTKPFLRMTIGLAANVAANDAPVLYDWALTYHCRSAL